MYTLQDVHRTFVESSTKQKNIKTESLVNSANVPVAKMKESKPIAAPSHEIIKREKPVINNSVKKNIVKPISKPIIKPIKKVEPKPLVKKPEPKKLKQEEKQKPKPIPKAVMPKEQHTSHPNNDY